MMVRSSILALIMVGIAQPSFGYCIKPSVPYSFKFPELLFLSKPDLPYCMSGFKYTGKHSCESWEVDSYINELEEYQRKLETYLSDVDTYMKKARKLANEAENYATCAMNEALDDIE